MDSEEVKLKNCRTLDEIQFGLIFSTLFPFEHGLLLKGIWVMFRLLTKVTFLTLEELRHGRKGFRADGSVKDFSFATFSWFT